MASARAEMELRKQAEQRLALEKKTLALVEERLKVRRRCSSMVDEVAAVHAPPLSLVHDRAVRDPPDTHLEFPAL